MLRKIIFSITATCIFIVTYSMDLIESSRHAIIPSNTHIAGSFLLVHKIDLFDHDMVCSLVVNKEWEGIVKSVAPKLRAYLARKIPGHFFNACDGSLVWHKYGTAFARKYVYICEGRNKRGEKNVAYNLESFYLARGDIEIYTSGSLYATERTIQDIIRPRFSEAGDFCFYGIGENMRLWDKSEHVVEHCLVRNKFFSSLYSSVQNFRCGLLIKRRKKDDYYAMSHFLSFPVLLGSFLNSKVVELAPRLSKLYSLKDSIIPHNYQLCVPLDKDGYQSFSELPKKLRNKIMKHYDKQKRKDNEQGFTIVKMWKNVVSVLTPPSD